MKRVPLLLAGVLSSLAAVAQAGGSLSGLIDDPVGAAVAGAHVVIIPLDETAPLVLAVSDAEGRWSRDELPHGDYRVAAAKSGFQTAIRSLVKLAEGASRSVDLTLTPAELAGGERKADLAWLVRGLSGDVLRLDGGSLVQRDEDRLRIRVPTGFSAQRVEDRRDALEAACERFFGRTMRVEIEVARVDDPEQHPGAPQRDAEATRRLRQEALNHPAVDAARELLDGEIVEIRPIGESR